MKKRIFALLLAGVMAISMASCVATGDGDGDDTKEQTKVTLPSQTIAGVTLTTVNQTVYTIVDNAKLLTDITDTKGDLTVKKLTKMTRIKTSATWSIVEYKNVQYYISSKSLTADDLYGETFDTCTATTMYVKSKANLRTYASADSNISPIVKELNAGEAVTVIATGQPSSTSDAEWSKLRYTDSSNQVKNYFVRSDLLTEKKDGGTTPGGDGGTLPSNFESYFEAVPETKMYVHTASYPDGNLYLRSQPLVSGDTGVKTVKDDTEVIVIKMGKDSYNGWCKVKVAKEKTDPSAPQFYDEYYVGYKNLTPFKTGMASTLAEIQEKYPAFAAANKTLYVSSNLNVRSFPDLNTTVEDSPNNIVKGLKTKDMIKVVAEGTQGGVLWYAIELTSGEKTNYGFISAKYTTPDSYGNPVLTLDELLTANKSFSKLPQVKTYVASTQIACSMGLGDNWGTSKTLATGTEVVVVAEGTAQGARLYIVQIDGYYYFAEAANLTEKTA